MTTKPAPATSPTKHTTRQTVRIGGKRTILTTRNGKVTAKPAAVLEWQLQAAAVRALRSMPEYVSDAACVKPGTFSLAGDFNAARRSMTESAKAIATGLTKGEHDLRLYLYAGRLALIEFKAANGRLAPEQRDRHALLAALGFDRQALVRAATEDDAAAQAVALVRGWLAANDNTTKSENLAA